MWLRLMWPDVAVLPDVADVAPQLSNGQGVADVALQLSHMHYVAVLPDVADVAPQLSNGQSVADVALQLSHLHYVAVLHRNTAWDNGCLLFAG